MFRLNKLKLHKLNTWVKFCLGAAIFTLPFQLNIFVYEAMWGRGFINPYTSIWLNLSDILILMAGILFFIWVKRKKRQIEIGQPGFFMILLMMIAIAGISIFLSPFSDSTFQFLLLAKLLELVIFYLLIVNRTLYARDTLEIFTIAMGVQALIAILQVILQHSIGLSFLGEPGLGPEMAHIARFTFGDATIIRGYGTMSHPNVLGGFLTVSLFSTLLFSPHAKHERMILLIVQFLGLLATFSRSAMLAFVIGLVIISFWYFKHIKTIKNKLIPISIIALFSAELIFLIVSRGLEIWNDPGVIERIEGFKAALTLFREHPFGVGFGHFTLFLDQISTATLMPWEYQPVHNIILLTMSEAGTIGLIGLTGAIVFAFFKLFQKRKRLLTHGQLFKKRILVVICLSLLMIGMIDHYIFTLDQGRFLLILSFAIVSRFTADPKHVLPIRKGGSLSKILSAQ